MNTQSESQRSSDEVIDGRTARRDRGRNAVLEAALELWEEENLEPSPEQIAQRAGVSTRSVYRYFEDRDQLVRAIIAHKQLQILPLFRIEDMGQGDLELRISRFVDSRLEVYEAIGASSRAMTIKAAGDPVIAEQIAFRKAEFRQQVVRQFDNELAQMTDTERMVSLNSVDALTQAESLDRFRRELQLSKDDCRTLLVASIRALLTTLA